MLQEGDFPKLTGPYLGQKPPGMTPEIFAPGIVSSKEFVDFKLAFSPDGTECYFYRLSHPSDELIPTIFFTKVVNGIWTKPAKLQIAQGASAFHPCVSQDNQWLLFYWQFGQNQIRQTGFYASARTDTGWSVPRYAGQGMYLTSDNAGRFYTTQSVWGAQPKHYLAKVAFSNGLFSNYERLNIPTHYGKQTHPCIAPDGSYIIFDTEDTDSRIFVSFKDKEGNWGEAFDLTAHGFKPQTRGAYISPDGKYLFFSVDADIWWVDIRVIENLRPKKVSLEIFAPGIISSKEFAESKSSFSPDGKLIFFPRDGDIKWVSTDIFDQLNPAKEEIAYAITPPNGSAEIFLMNADGTSPIKLTDNPSQDWWPKFSPDGSKIAFQSRRDGNHEIYVMNCDGSHPVRLTNNSADDEDPNWSPDGMRIAFISMRDGHYEIYTMNEDGSNQTRITTTDGHAIDPDWKPSRK